MGTWAEGNFDNDGALDYVGEVIDSLVARIEDCFAEEGMAALDEDGEAVIVPTVAIISLLHEHCKAAPPHKEAVATWKKNYMAIFDASVENLSPVEGYAAARRKVIEDTFTKLENQVRAFWADG